MGQLTVEAKVLAKTIENVDGGFAKSNSGPIEYKLGPSDQNFISEKFRILFPSPQSFPCSLPNLRIGPYFLIRKKALPLW